MKRHERTHTGEKPFDYKVTLKTIREPTQGKPLDRSHSEKVFTDEDNLKTHERKRTGEKLFD